VDTVIDYEQHRKVNRTQRWDRRRPAELLGQCRDKETERLAQTMTSTRRRGTRFPCCEAKSGRAANQCQFSIIHHGHTKAVCADR
jgi:hypothetical protein